MEKQKITYINRTTRTSKAGKPYESLSIKTDRHGEKFLGGFGSKETNDWKVGDEVEIEVKEVASADGTKTYLNFDYARKPSLETRIIALEGTLTLLKNAMEPIYKEWRARNPQKPVEVVGAVERPTEESNPEDIPF